MRETSEVEKISGQEPKLRRTIGPAQMALYGLGSMLGAGIYGLIGKAAGVAGNAVLLALIVALLARVRTALSGIYRQHRPLVRPREYPSVVARARLPLDPERHCAPRYSRVDVG